VLKELEKYYVTKAYFRHECPQFFAQYLMRRERGLKGGIIFYNDGSYTFGRHPGILEGEPDFERDTHGHYEEVRQNTNLK